MYKLKQTKESTCTGCVFDTSFKCTRPEDYPDCYPVCEQVDKKETVVEHYIYIEEPENEDGI